MEWVTLNTKRSTSIAKLARTPTPNSNPFDRVKRSVVNVRNARKSPRLRSRGVFPNGIVAVQTVVVSAAVPSKLVRAHRLR